MSFGETNNDYPWLSVVMPVHNGRKTIVEALDSISCQDDPQVEVVVVDDESTDSTLRIVQSYAGRLNLKVIQRKHTGNWVSSTNLGIREASGRYLCFLHQDDRWEDGRLAAIRKVLCEDSAVKMCFHPALFLGPDGRVLGRWRCPFASRSGVQAIQPETMLQCLLVQNFIAICAPVFSKDSALKVGLLDEVLLYTADWDFWIKLSSLGPSIFLPGFHASFRVHRESQTARLSANADYMEQQLRCVLERHWKRYVPGGSGGDGLRRMAEFSISLNTALMKLARRQTVGLLPLAIDFLRLGPHNWPYFFRCSRVLDRGLARLRIRHGP